MEFISQMCTFYIDYKVVWCLSPLVLISNYMIKLEHLKKNLQHKSQHEVSIMKWVLLQLKNMNGFYFYFAYIFMSLGSMFFLLCVNVSLFFSLTTIFAMMYLLKNLVSGYIIFWKLSCFLDILRCM